MKAPQAPRLEKRRTADFSRELRERTQAWIPSWDTTDGQGDFGLALLDITARFSSEVAERLDRTGGKMRAGLLDWLGVRGKAARPARMPVVFKLSDSARETVPAPAPIRLQVDAGGTPVIFETETSLDLVPARLEVVAAVDPANDAYYLPPPDLSSLAAVDHLPTQWKLKNFAPAKATTLQLSPELGLAAGIILEANSKQYRIESSDKDLVTINPALAASLDAGVTVSKVIAFSPFDGGAHNRQAHELYLGDSDLLNVEAAAKIAVVGAAALRADISWQYWGKKGTGEAGWQDLTVASSKDQTVPDALVLSKPSGSIDPKEIAGHSARWIRAYAQTVQADKDPFTAKGLKLLINPSKCAAEPCPPGAGATPPEADGISNTTPLVLDNLFFPLGKEPRQFDAFYLGSNEAFSKKGANAQLCFEMADRTFSSLSAVRGINFGANRVLVGVGKDRALHLLEINSDSGVARPFRQRIPLYPPSPGIATGPQAGSVVTLDKQPRWRPPVWPESVFNLPGFLTAVCSGRSIWVWREQAFNVGSGWEASFGQLPSTANPSAQVDGLVFLADGGDKLVALRDGSLFVRDWPVTKDWEKKDPKDGQVPLRLVSIVAIRTFKLDGFGGFTESGTAGMLGIGDNGAMYQVTATGACTRVLKNDLFNTDVLPAAVQLGPDLIVAGVLKTQPPGLLTLVANHTSKGRKQVDKISDIAVALEPVIRQGVFHVLMTASDQGLGALLDWAPFDASPGLFVSHFSKGTARGSPTEIDGLVVVPGSRADVLSSKYDPQDRFKADVTVKEGIVVDRAFPKLSAGDLIVRIDSAGSPVANKITAAGQTKDSDTFYPLDGGFPPDGTRLDAYTLLQPFTGKNTGAGLWELDASDSQTTKLSWLRNDKNFFRVDDINLQREATLHSPNGSKPVDGPYTPARPTNGSIAPFLDSVPGNWSADVLNRLPLHFPNNDPTSQRAKAFTVDANNHPTLLVLGTEFTDILAYPAPMISFMLDAAVSDWQRDTEDTSSNPELSWEYWSGKGWSKLNLTNDDTGNLKITGAIRFTVPTDIEPSDWAGKTNPWIRARLIGGDYGREKVSFDSKSGVVTRSTDDIRPPSVLKLTISYGFCTAVLPAFVLTSDGGSVRDQSNANRSSGAIVEAFVPLAVALGRLCKAQLPATVPVPQTGPPPCVCPGQDPTAPNPATTGATSALPPVSLLMERCLFVGLSGPFSGEAVNILLLVESEQSYTQLAPLTVEALVANQFVPIVASDGTRAIGESGVIAMSFAVPPASADLFGRSLIWLRLAPQSTGDWKPSIRGAYLNAVFASARETLTRELVGSSEGAPGLTLTLARPPLVHNSLELRVREPLGDEDRADLLQRGMVVSDADGLPGDWVLWKQVSDPADQPSSARVYALDEGSGEIRFGDGIQGMIPPIGRDSIVAFRYQRTEPPAAGSNAVPGNLIAARTTLNLVSPVETVESVTSAGDSAGGAASESDDLVLQFGYARIRHRDRALTLRDFEDIALESSPTIIQARAFLNPGGKILLIAIMRGKDPRPNAAQVRELRRYLLSFAPAALAAPGVLTIAPPKLRYLRLVLDLDIPTLDVAVDLSKFVKSALAGLFDGWTLGQSPTDDDIATVLARAPGLQSIVDISLREVAADGTEVPWPVRLKPTELAMLAADPVGLQLHSLEVSV